MKIIPQETQSIFVFDDELPNVESLANILEFDEYRVIRAASGEAASTIVDREQRARRQFIHHPQPLE